MTARPVATMLQAAASPRSSCVRPCSSVGVPLRPLFRSPTRSRQARSLQSPAQQPQSSSSHCVMSRRSKTHWSGSTRTSLLSNANPILGCTLVPLHFLSIIPRHKVYVTGTKAVQTLCGSDDDSAGGFTALKTKMKTRRVMTVYCFSLAGRDTVLASKLRRSQTAGCISRVECQ